MNVHLSRFFVQPGLLRLYAPEGRRLSPQGHRCSVGAAAACAQGSEQGSSLSNRVNIFDRALDAAGHPVAEAMPHRLFAIPCAVLCGGSFPYVRAHDVRMCPSSAA
jgi:hypothetical protein